MLVILVFVSYAMQTTVIDPADVDSLTAALDKHNVSELLLSSPYLTCIILVVCLCWS